MGQNLSVFADGIDAAIEPCKWSDKKGIEDAMYYWQILQASELVRESV